MASKHSASQKRRWNAYPALRRCAAYALESGDPGEAADGQGGEKRDRRGERGGLIRVDPQQL